MNRKGTEALVGFFVLLGIAALVFLSLKAANLSSFSGGETYTLTAKFDNIGGLKVRSPVRSAGVTVGRVTSIALDPKTFQGVVTLDMQKSVQFPNDSSARILTSGLLGDQYVGLEAGPGEKNFAAGDTIKQTQSAIVLESLISQFPVQQGSGCRHDDARTCIRTPSHRRQEVTRSLDTRSFLARALLALMVGALLALGGCASTQNFAKEARGGPGARLDPWENWNRKVFAFNEGLDEKVLKPVATGYAKVVPQFVRRSVDNFFANAADAWSAVNNVLQGKPEPAFTDVVRFTTNTVFGFFGILDIATEFGLEHHYEDFGQTLGRWGFGAGAYIVWPLIGPSTVRESIALPLDRTASPALYISSGSYQFGVVGLQIVNTRAKLLGASQVIDDIALDKYTFVRDAYLQRRRSLVFDGDAPPESPDAAASGAAGSDSIYAPAPPATAGSAPPKP